MLGWETQLMRQEASLQASPSVSMNISAEILMKPSHLKAITTSQASLASHKYLHTRTKSCHREQLGFILALYSSRHRSLEKPNRGHGPPACVLSRWSIPSYSAPAGQLGKSPPNRVALSLLSTLCGPEVLSRLHAV